MLAVLERRVQSTQPDLALITNVLMSLSSLTQQAAHVCNGALGWPDSIEDPRISLRVGVDEAARLLAIEMFESELVLVNGIADDSATALQSTIRSVVVSAVLAFCDQRVAGHTLEVTCPDAAVGSQPAGVLQMRMLAGNPGKSPAFPASMRKPRLIDWADVQAIAESCGVDMARCEGWLTLDLSRPAAGEPT